MERYLCKECGAPATVQDFTIHRTCDHKGTVLLDMSVTCYGEGGMRDQSRLRKLVDTIISILRWRSA
jgi:hypothetical protein